MAPIQIAVQKLDNNGLMRVESDPFVIDAKAVREHSATVEELLRAKPDTTKVVLTGVAPPAVRYILDRINDKFPGRPLHIKVHDRPLEEACIIFEAIDVLRLTTPQGHVEGHITGYVAHNLLTAKQLITVALIGLPRRETSKIWNTLVHQTAWNIVNGKYTWDQANFLGYSADRFPALRQAIDAKAYELIPRYQRWLARKEAHAFAEMVRLAKEEENRKSIEARKANEAAEKSGGQGEGQGGKGRGKGGGKKGQGEGKKWGGQQGGW
jgi:hypothetical protein